MRRIKPGAARIVIGKDRQALDPIKNCKASQISSITSRPDGCVNMSHAQCGLDAFSQCKSGIHRVIGIYADYATGDGVIAWPTEAREDLSDLIVRSPCPVVVMNLNVPSIHTHRFDFDSHALGRLAAAHFVDRAFTSSAWYSRSASSSTTQSSSSRTSRGTWTSRT